MLWQLFIRHRAGGYSTVTVVKQIKIGDMTMANKNFNDQVNPTAGKAKKTAKKKVGKKKGK